MKTGALGKHETDRFQSDHANRKGQLTFQLRHPFRWGLLCTWSQNNNILISGRFQVVKDGRGL